MRSLQTFLLATSAMLPVAAAAQSSPHCPTRPTTLAAMRTCYRPLLVFAPTVSDPRLSEQQSILDHDADDMMDRNVLLVPFSGQPAASQTQPQLPLDTPYALLSRTEQAAARRRFHVPLTAFAVILLGEDGGEKLRASTPIPSDKLNGLIDIMPTRRLEMQQPHTN